MTVKETDIPGPTSLEQYQLVHGDKPESTETREARMDALYQDFRTRMDRLLMQPRTVAIKTSLDVHKPETVELSLDFPAFFDKDGIRIA